MGQLWPRAISEADWRRVESQLGEILTSRAFRPKRPGPRRTPERFLGAMIDATDGSKATKTS
jgi:hypothetical protein